MASPKTITVNGRKYDAVTGLLIAEAPKAPAEKPRSTAPKKPVPSESIHTSTQRSKTLYRRAAKKPVASQKTTKEKPATPSPAVVKRPSQTGRHMDIARSNAVTKFAKHPVTAKKPEITKSVDRPAVPHPAVKRALAKKQVKSVKADVAKPKTAKDVKDAAIKKALAAPKVTPPKKQARKDRRAEKKAKKSPWVRRLQVLGIVVAGLAVIGFAVYHFIPNVSVQYAASRAGINATYPEFTPDGYSLKQPVKYSDGEVTITFKSNSNEGVYTVSQKRSSWDSSAVLDNIVKANTENYTTTKERGLTIYSFNDTSVWVNGGLLYTIKSDQQLSGDQIRRIATSL